MRILLLLALVAAPVVASAQASFGVRAGLNVSNVYGFEDDTFNGIDRTPALGFIGGLTATLPITPSFGVQAEALYSQKGFRITSENEAVPDVDLSVDYLEIPVLARVALPVGPFADAGVLLGPALALKVRDNVTFDGVDLPDDTETDVDAFESLDVGVVAAAEYGSGPYSVQARYTFGLVDVSREQSDQIPGGGTITPRNGVFSITGAITFGG